ncbi:metal-dependent transcriptional regulator [Clostridium polynesiense]|uniref:metal-dependent transcriptional regulator n=1 Tax=Clostridium polynesiense TaxID=1325933 RepID=UPI00058BBECE|nr:metal-dependent transcriptional regulator [Clostridium polynesiense]
MTRNKQDYLKIIYELGGNINPVNNKDIASALGVSPPSVSEMIKKLLEEGYLEYTPYKGIKLTDYGIKEASKIVRKHRLWEVFLINHLGYSWDEVHDEAEKLEHVTSSQLEKRLQEYLNFPKACPHGSLIPYSEEDVDSTPYRSLDTLKEGEKAVIKRVTDKKPLLKYLMHLGLAIGDEISIINLAPYNGPITLIKQDKKIIIGKEASELIYVE